MRSFFICVVVCCCPIIEVCEYSDCLMYVFFGIEEKMQGILRLLSKASIWMQIK